MFDEKSRLQLITKVWIVEKKKKKKKKTKIYDKKTLRHNILCIMHKVSM
jgi:hypothetical protein